MTTQSLRFLPVGWFGLAMGLAGLAFVLRNAAKVLGVPAALGEVVALGAIALEALLVAAYAARYLRHRDAVVAEFANPATMGFTATFPVSLMLVAGCLAPWAEASAASMWWLGAGILLIYQLYALARWLSGGFDAAQINGGSLIIVLAGLVAPIGGLPLGLLKASQILFGISLAIAPFMVGVLFWRTMVGPRLPDAMRPSLFIFLVPPSLVYVFYGPLAGESPFWTQACLYVSVMLASALLISSRDFLRWPFGAPWAAFTFPLVALASAALRNAALQPSTAASALAWATLALAACAVALVLARALGALARGTLCQIPPPPPQPPQQTADAGHRP